MANEPWVDSKSASQHLGANIDWLVSNVKKLQIPHAKLGRQYRFRLSEIDEWINQHLRKGGEF